MATTGAPPPEPPSAEPPQPAPVVSAERLTAVDTLRGFALLGVLIVNMGIFSRPLYLGASGVLHGESPLDTTVHRLTYLLVEGKFYAIFSLLFGLGFFLQMERSKARTGSFTRLFARRLAVLLGIGAVHAVLIWSGDILVTYALLGFPLLLFREVSSRWLLLLIPVLLALPVVFLGGMVALLSLARLTPQGSEELQQAFAEQEQTVGEEIARAFHVYGSGDWLDTVLHRLHELPTVYASSLFTTFPIVFALFLLGLWMGRTGVLHQPGAHQRFLRRAGLVSLVVGLALSGVAASLHGRTLLYHLTPASFLQLSTFLLGGPFLGFAYLCGLALLLRHEAWLRRLAPLAAVGRLSLSNYLLQSLVCTTLFYGYGLGLYGKTGPALNLLIALALYSAQVALSVGWVRRFRLGPAEWLWRSLTYGRRQPLRRAHAPSGGGSP